MTRTHRQSCMKYCYNFVCNTLLYVVLVQNFSQVYAEVGGDDCEWCKIGTYANETGTSRCMTCAVGTFATTPGQQFCEACAEGIFPGYDGLSMCSLEKIPFILKNRPDISAIMLSGPGKMNWLIISHTDVTLREILNSIQVELNVGDNSRVEPVFLHQKEMDPVVLYRISDGVVGTWSPLNIAPLHTDNTTQYLFWIVCHFQMTDKTQIPEFQNRYISFFMLFQGKSNKFRRICSAFL